MASLLASLLIKLGLDAAEVKPGLSVVERDLQIATKRIEKIGKNMVGVGEKLSAAVTLPLVAMGGLAVKGALDQAQAMAQVEAALTSMGNVSGRTAEQLAKNADALEMRSLYDADVILTKVTANLLTFGNVSGDVFDRAQQAILDVSQRLNGDLQGATIMVGKALNDPANGLAALGKTGALSKAWIAANKDMIKGLVEAGQTAKAQGIILTALEAQYKGAAQAAADTAPLRKAEVAWNQAMDKIGEAILPVLPVIGNAIAGIADAFANLSPEAQKFIIIAAGVAAALGPVLVILGNIVTLTAPLVAAFTTMSAATTAAGVAAGGASTGFAALAAAAAPWLAVAAAVAGVGYLIYQNWDKIAPVLERVWTAISSTLGPPLQKIVDTASAMLIGLWNGPLGEWLRTVVSQLGTLAAAFVRTFGPVVLGVLKLAFTMIATGLETLLEVGRAVGSLFAGDVPGAFEHLGRAVNTLFGGMPAKVIGWMAQLVTGVKSWLVDKLNAVWDWVIGKVQAVGQAFFKLYDAVVGHSYIPDMVDEIGQHMRRLDEELVKPAKQNASKAEEAFRALQERVSGILARLFPEAAARNTFDAELAALNQYYDGLLKTTPLKAKILEIERQRAAAIEALRREYQGLHRDMLAIAPGEQAPGIEVADGTKSVEDISKEVADRAADALGKVGKQAEVTKVQVVESFTQMMDGALNQIDRFVRGIKSGNWLDIIGGLLNAIDGIAAAFTGGEGTSLGPFTFGDRSGTMPRYANGTDFHPGGLAVVGERGREVVNLPRGSQVHSNRELEALGAAGGNGVLTVKLEKDGSMSAFLEGIAGKVVDERTPGIAKGATNAALARMGRLQQKSLTFG